jgi:hypothetical protein
VTLPIARGLFEPALPGAEVDYVGLGLIAALFVGLVVGAVLCARDGLEEVGTGVVRGTLGGVLVWMGVGLFGLALMSSIGG